MTVFPTLQPVPHPNPGGLPQATQGGHLAAGV